jgi:hypothetical protein
VDLAPKTTVHTETCQKMKNIPRPSMPIYPQTAGVILLPAI